MQLGPFELVKEIGQGGMGTVWSGRHRTLGVPVAVKIMARDLADDADFLEFFQREIRATARLTHPHVIWVYDHGVLPEHFAGHASLEPGLPYLVMEYCSETLRERLMSLTGWDDLAAILVHLLEALAHAHARGVVHCDLKIDNVLYATRVDQRPGLKLCDFGIALFAGERGEARGTPSHMAPEQFHALGGRAVGPWSDLYALGVLAWTMVTGQRPFPNEDDVAALLKHKLAGCTARFQPRIDVPPRLEPWLRTLMVADPVDRFRSAADARAGLLALRRAPVFVQPSEEVTLPPDRELEVHRLLRSATLPTSWRGAAAPVASPVVQGAGLALLGLRDPPIVAREEQRDALWGALVEVSRGMQPIGVVLHGEEGVGASALARWLATTADESAGVITVWLDGRESGEDPADALLERLLKLDALDSESRATARLRLLGADYGSATAALSELMSRRVEDGKLRRGLVLQILGAVARQRPVIVVLDSLDERMALHTLMKRGLEGHGRVLWVATAAQPVADLDVRTIGLDTMPDEGVIAVLRELLPITDRLAADLARRAQGRPRFAVDALRELAARGDLEIVDGEWTLKARASLSRERETERFIEDLDNEERRAVLLAAVIGEVVPRAAYLRACGDLGVRPAALEMVERMSRRGMFEAAPRGWRFRSPQIRAAMLDYARGTLDWFALHESAAMALDAEGEPDFLVGQVLAAGGDVKNGLQRIVRDVARIRETESRETALTVVRDGLNAAMESTLALQERLHGELWWWEAELLRLLHRDDECRDVAERAMEMARTLGWKRIASRLALSLGKLSIGDVDEALKWLALAEKLVDANASVQRAEILERRGSTLFGAGRVADGANAWREAVRLLEGAEDGASGAASARMQCYLAGLAGDHQAAYALGRSAVERVREHQPTEYLSTLILFGEAAIRVGAVREGRKAFQEAAERASLAGSPFFSGLSLVNLAVTDVRLNAWTAAEQNAMSALQVLDGRDLRMFADLVLVVVAAKRNRTTEAEKMFDLLRPVLDSVRKPEPDAAFLLETLASVAERSLPGVATQASRFARRERRKLEMTAAKA
ncbi:MAG: protein kinase [Alphaproteobacteria bacterium]|nr:protein kinase [Alphaproteobacteria bacterium]